MLKSMSGNGSMWSCDSTWATKFEEEPQLADLDGLLHDVHAEEVVDDDGLEDEVVKIGVTFRPSSSILRKSGNFLDS
jgi:hypothetical protein